MKHTQEHQILAYLKKLGTITPGEAWSLGILRLGARIYDLRRKGHKIITDRKRTRGGAIVAQYRLTGMM